MFIYSIERIMQGGVLLSIIFTLSIECRFQEPTISPLSQKKEDVAIPFPERANIDAYTLHKINSIIQDVSNKKDLSQGDKLSMISARFLGTPYQSNRLHGSERIPEQLVIDFRSVDCFTYLDYVVALQASHSPHEFFTNIVNTRYINSEIHFYKRKHFFTDWANSQRPIAEDITPTLAHNAIKKIKHLNKKNDKKQHIDGIPVISRPVVYIPGEAIDMHLVSKLKSGDLIGIYTPLAGLDVSHVGMFIMTPHGPVLRHASSTKENRGVVDSPFISYASKKPGIIVLRVTGSSSHEQQGTRINMNKQ